MKIAVFCASANHLNVHYREAARELGQEIGKQSWHLIYGGTNLGLMKEVADATIDNGGDVTGIIPQCIFEKGVGAADKGELIVTPDIKERKHLLRELADAFVVLPGGWGTLEEVTEVITLKQLGIHQKPIVFLNIDGFYNRFFGFISQCREEGVISGYYDQIYKVAEKTEEAISYIRNDQGICFQSKY